MKGRLILISLLVLITSIAIVAIWSQIASEYQAAAEVWVRPIVPHLVFKSEDNGAIPLYDSFVNTQVSNIQNITVLQRVLDQPEVRQTEWYKNPPKSLLNRLTGSMPNALDRLRDNLSAKPRRETEIIDVTFTGSNAKEAQVITNTILEQYIKYIGEMSDATQDKIYNQLVDQYKSLERDIQGREKVIDTLSRQLGTTSAEELVSRQRDRLDRTQDRLSEIKHSIAMLEWEAKQTNHNDSNDVVDKASENLKHQLARLKHEEQLLVDQLKKQQVAFDELFVRTQMLKEENARLLHKRELFNAVQRRLDQKNMERNMPGAIEILTQAVTPTEPNKDHRPLFSLIVLILSASMGSVIVFLRRTHITEGKES